MLADYLVYVCCSFRSCCRLVLLLLLLHLASWLVEFNLLIESEVREMKKRRRMWRDERRDR